MGEYMIIHDGSKMPCRRTLSETPLTAVPARSHLGLSNIAFPYATLFNSHCKRHRIPWRCSFALSVFMGEILRHNKSLALLGYCMCTSVPAIPPLTNRRSSMLPLAESFDRSLAKKYEGTTDTSLDPSQSHAPTKHWTASCLSRHADLHA